METDKLSESCLIFIHNLKKDRIVWHTTLHACPVCILLAKLYHIKDLQLY